TWSGVLGLAAGSVRSDAYDSHLLRSWHHAPDAGEGRRASVRDPGGPQPQRGESGTGDSRDGKGVRRLQMMLAVVGVNELARNLVGLGRRFSAKTPLEAAVLRGGNIIAAEAARLAPQDTGKGAESIACRIISSRRGVVVGAIGPGRNQFY